MYFYYSLPIVVVNLLFECVSDFTVARAVLELHQLPVIQNRWNYTFNKYSGVTFMESEIAILG
jgi:hypothetical protein